MGGEICFIYLFILFHEQASSNAFLSAPLTPMLRDIGILQQYPFTCTHSVKSSPVFLLPSSR